MEYIVVIPVFISAEVYFCSSLEQVKQTINDMCISPKEIDEVRVFKIDTEVNVKALFK